MKVSLAILYPPPINKTIFFTSKLQASMLILALNVKKTEQKKTGNFINIIWIV